MVKVDFKNRIREIRKQEGLRQIDLAKMVGVLQSEISEIECGKRAPSIYLAKRLVKVF